MKVHEYQAKALMAQYGVPIPRGQVASTPSDARRITEELGGRSVIKAQVHAGARGKAGGIILADSPKEAEGAAVSLLDKQLVTAQTGPEGAPVHRVLVEQTVDVAKELYLAITVDRTYRGPVVIACEAGGMDIEEVANTSPERILREGVDPLIGFQGFQGRRLAEGMGLDRAQSRQASDIMAGLTRLFDDMDCSLVEVNPLVVTADGSLLALDGKVSLDDDAVFRHPEAQELRDPEQEDPLESQAIDAGIAYVKLDGDVGCLVNGAGLAMATMDVIKGAGMSPANFLDVGGGASVEKVAEACRLMLSDPDVKRVLLNVFGGILRCDIAAAGVIQAFRETNCQLPLYVRMLGTNVDEGAAALRESGLDVTFSQSLSEVAAALAASPESRK